MVKSSRLSVQPSSDDDELSSSHPNVSLTLSGPVPGTSRTAADSGEVKLSRVQTPSSGTFTADEDEELKGTAVHATVDERKLYGACVKLQAHRESEKNNQFSSLCVSFNI